MTLDQQLASARRELALRKKVFPAWIQNGRLTHEKADHELACMTAIVGTLEKLKHLNEAADELNLRIEAGRPPSQPDNGMVIRSERD